MTRRAYDDETELRIVKLYELGMSASRIAAEVGNTDTAVRNALKRRGVKTKRTFADYQSWQATPQQKATVVTLYSEGKSVREIAKAMECRTNRVAETLVEAGIDLGPRRGNPKFQDDIAEAIVKEYDEGASLRDLANKYKNNSFTISSTIRRLGTSIRMNGRPEFWTSERESAVVELYRLGQDHEAIAEAFGTSVAAITRVLRRQGVFAPKRLAEDHQSWAGGRVSLAGGYVGVRAYGDDYKFGRINASGYIPEHRLVMGRHLGRMIRLDESVHHINGKRDDNRIENLQLRQGAHGKGVAMECQACGSVDVAPVPLAS